MKKFNIRFLAVFMLFLSYGAFAQIFPFGDLVCLELTTADGETSVIGMTANALEATQAALELEGISSEVVECDDDFNFPIDSIINTDPIGGGWGDPFGDLVCLELTTADGETSVIGVTADFVEETQAQLDEQGISSEVVECDDEFTFPIDSLGWIDLIGGGGWNHPPVELVCLELTTPDGETSVIGVTADFVEETQAQLDEQGISSEVVECDDEFTFPIDSLGWIDLIGGGWNFPPVELVCLELTTPDGETSVIGLTANALESTQAALEAEGISSEVVECEDEFGDISEAVWNIDPIDFEIPGDLLCLELTSADGETSTISITANILDATQAALTEAGISSEVVPCEESFSPDNNGQNKGLDVLKTNIAELGIFPNPASGLSPISVNFESETNEDVVLSVFNQFGQRVTDRQLNVTKGRNTVELNSVELGTGLFIVSLSNGKEFNISKKLMIIK